MIIKKRKIIKNLKPSPTVKDTEETDCYGSITLTLRARAFRMVDF